MTDRTIGFCVPPTKPSDEQIRAAVDSYAGEHGLTTGATAEEAAQIRQNTAGISSMSEELVVLREDLIELGKTQSITKNYTLEYGYITSGGTEHADSDPSAFMRTVDYFSVPENADIFTVVTVTSGGTLYVCYYDADKVFQSRVALSKGAVLDTSYEYFRLSFYRGTNYGGSDEAVFKSWILWNLSSDTDERFTSLEDRTASLEDRAGSLEERAASLISADKTDFFDVDVLNLFDGNYFSGISIAGSAGSTTIKEDSGFHSTAIVKVKPNTDYSIIVADGGAEDTGYYYLKIAEIYLENVNKAEDVIGAAHNLLFTQTSKYVKNVTVTTNEAATYLVVQASKTKQPFLQIVEGIQTDFTVSSYDEQSVGTPNKKINVYSKGEIDALIGAASANVAQKSGNVLTICMGKAKYSFERITDESINIDTWRLYYGGLLKPDGSYFTMWSDSDAEGAVKISGEDDFLGGFHGDEIMTDVHIFVDGTELNLNEDFDTVTFANITAYVESDLYHCNTSELADTKAFTRNKMLVFSGNTVKVANCYTALSDLTMEYARIALFQCYYKENDTEVLTNYSVNTDYKMYSLADTSEYPASSENMTEAHMETKYATIDFKSDKTSGQNYKGAVSVGFVTSQNRLKFYFDTICSDGASITAGEKMYSEFEWMIS